MWETIRALTWIEMFSLIAATVFNLFTYWWQMQAAMPGLTLGQAAVSNQTSTTVSNLVPGAGVVATGLMYGMFHSWGFTGSEVALLASTTGIWNTFLKLGLPIMAVALLAIIGPGHEYPARAGADRARVPRRQRRPVRDGAVEEVTRPGDRNPARRDLVDGPRAGFRKPPVDTWGEGAVRFRKQTIGLVVRRWPALTITTIVSHLALWFVLLLSLRHVGVSVHEVSTIQVLAVFAFSRLISAIPITPGGVGLVELSLIGGLYAAGRTHADVPLDEFKVQVTAAALLFRTLTYGVQIPLGGFTYLIWQRKKSWRKPQPEAPQPSTVPAGSPRMRTRIRGAAPHVVSLLVLLAACTESASAPPPRSPDAIRVAAFGFTESEILAELYSQAL